MEKEVCAADAFRFIQSPDIFNNLTLCEFVSMSTWQRKEFSGRFTPSIPDTSLLSLILC